MDVVSAHYVTPPCEEVFLWMSFTHHTTCEALDIFSPCAVANGFILRTLEFGQRFISLLIIPAKEGHSVWMLSFVVVYNGTVKYRDRFL